MLKASGVSKSFGGLKAVAGVELTARAGQITSLIGPNGAGKTTLFALISGFLAPDGGRIAFDGQDITGLRPHAICQLGLVRTFQVVRPFAELTVRDNIAVGAHTRIRARKAARAKAEEIAALMGMEEMLDQSAGSLTISGRKRLELARALATGPRLLLLDEVMAGLNATEVGEIVGVVRRIRDSGVTIFLIEHVMQAVMSLSDQTFVLNNGELIAQGTPQAVAADPLVIEAYLGHGAATRLASGGTAPKATNNHAPEKAPGRKAQSRKAGPKKTAASITEIATREVTVKKATPEKATAKKAAIKKAAIKKGTVKISAAKPARKTKKPQAGGSDA